MSLVLSKRVEIMQLLEQLDRVDARQVSTAFNINYNVARYHLERLVNTYYAQRAEDISPSGMKHIIYLYLIKVGISVTYNAKTGDGRNKPTLDITVTLQTVIARDEEQSWLSKVDRVVAIWFLDKFGDEQGAIIKPALDRKKRISVRFTVNRPEFGVDYWVPTITEVRKFGNIYAFYWNWSRMREGREPRTESLEGLALKYPIESIPIGPTSWTTAKKGKPRNEKL